MAELRASLRPKPVLKGRLIYRLQFSSVLNLSEREFAQLIQQVETDPLMRELSQGDPGGERAVFRRRYARERLASGFYEINERTQAAVESLDVQALLARRRGLMELIRRIGREDFERFFLYRETPEPLGAIARRCGISPEEASAVENLLLELSIHSEFLQPGDHVPAPSVHYTRIGQVEKDPDGGWSVAYFSPHLARGRYVLNRERIGAFRSGLGKEGRKRLDDLVRRLEWINLRQDTLHKGLFEVLRRQKAFLDSGREERRVAFSQRDLAQELKVSPSTVSRAVYGRTILLPWGLEAPLKGLFVSRRQVAESRVSEVLNSLQEDERERMTDAGLQQMLERRYGLEVSRRSVNLYRRKISPRARRKGK